MPIIGFEIVTVGSERITAYSLVWQRYKRRARGITEALLDFNPHLAEMHRSSPFIPVGTQVRIPIDLEMLNGRPQVTPPDLWTDRMGYTL